MRVLTALGDDNPPDSYAAEIDWRPARPNLSILRLAVSWVVAAAALAGAAWIVPGVQLHSVRGAFVAAAAVAALNTVLPPLIAAIRFPWTLAIGFVLVLAADAGALLIVAQLLPDDVGVDSFGDALLAALAVAAISIALETLLGTNDDVRYTVRVIERIARRRAQARTDVPGIVFLEIDGLALPVLRHAISAGNAPNMARWLGESGYRLTEWEPDLSSQTGASQAGILLGSNEDIPAFRWVDKEAGRVWTCSSARDCAAIERRLSTGRGLLANGGASRGNLLSGDADEAILTVSRMEAERRANPGYRAFLADGFNVTRALALFAWEVVLEWTAAIRQSRRDVRPRGHRGGIYPFLRAAMCVVVRDLVVFGVLSDMMSGRPAVYATFASYDEVAHHSGLEFGRIERARRYAPRPYEIVVLSDHGQTQGATFMQRNGFGLDELVQSCLQSASVAEFAGGDEQAAMVTHSITQATGAAPRRPEKDDVSDQHAVVLGSGNLGLIYLMAERRRLTLEEIDDRYPELIPALRGHPHVGWLLVRSRERGPVVLGARGARHLRDDRVDGEDPLARFSPHAARHLLRTDGFSNVADIMVGSFYDPRLEEGCAFEELISFHGGLGGPQTRPFILHPSRLQVPEGPIVGAAAVHALLLGWRESLQDRRGSGRSDKVTAARSTKG